jgi:anti-anti-sigma factor
MKVHAEKHGQTLVLALEGELDADASTELEQRCLYEQQEGTQHFAIALGGLERITGPGLRVLVGLARSLPRAGGSLVLCELQRPVEEALRVSALDRVFELAPDRAAAIRRSQALQSGTRPVSREASEEKIGYAIDLLGGK